MDIILTSGTVAKLLDVHLHFSWCYFIPCGLSYFIVHILFNDVGFMRNVTMIRFNVFCLKVNLFLQGVANLKLELTLKAVCKNFQNLNLRKFSKFQVSEILKF